ncbi:hypothetical protein [Bradyrhizobium sp. AUGA SZCCT0160]|uniref:hypothetical protein n=1 Tax=Bradyrhizobium sp. AUGA SZCCT0160 TaxID=2807662 RepID=UPI001BA56245|nr:hypothetical protein [Bradyrhizobium sp. AUGA SZCCT0160]MBR1190073.1 hypothetical protein [Bradyrhizobium sp. AUGA SZCCT0160]
MLTEKRKRGAQPGNWNALKHGRRSPRKRSERRAAHLVQFEARRAREKAWADAAPKIDYGKVADMIAADKARRAGAMH